MVALLVPAVALGANSTDAIGTITVDNPVAGKTYTAFKIFDVSYSGDDYSYTIDSDGQNSWFGEVMGYMGKEYNDETGKYDGAVNNAYTGEGITLTPSTNDPGVYVVTFTDAFSAPDFAEKMKTHVENKGGGQSLEAVADTDTVAVDELPLGYYLVSTDSGALCNLTTTNPTVTIHDKNDTKFEKAANKTTVNIGDTVNYVIEGKVQDSTGFEPDTYQYKVTDTMSDGLTFQGSVTVYVGGTVAADKSSVTNPVLMLTQGDQYTYTATPVGEGIAKTGFEVNVKIEKLQNYVGEPIYIVYSAVVNESALVGVETNNAHLSFTHDPNAVSNPKEIDRKVDVFTAQIKIDKDDESGQPLKGATFVLMNGDDTSAQYYKIASVDGRPTVTWVDTVEDADKFTTDAEGFTYISGLANGTYYLKETQAPDGYNPLTETPMININGQVANHAEVDGSLHPVKPIVNHSGGLLPNTGGIGTTLFYVGGGILIVGALAAFIIKRRSAKHTA